jgi:periplasmic protein TonB
MTSVRSIRQGEDSLWSWVVSAALHTLALGTAAPLLLDVTLPPRQATFRWDVAIRDTPPPEPLAAEVPSPLTSADVSSSARLDDLSPAEMDALQSQPRASFDDLDQAAPSVMDPVREADIPVHDVSPRAAASGHTDAAQRGTRARDDTSPGTSADTGMPTQSDATPLGASGPAALPPPEMEPVEPAPLAQDLVEEEIRRVVQRPQAVERSLRTRATQADYGWLAQSLWDQVERFKRYPYLARMNRWEGKVVLEAVIRRNGDLARVGIVESSGHGILDQDAIETLRRCAPVALAHPLDRREVTLHIPIMYRLD